MSDRVALLLAYHRTKRFGSNEELQRRQREAADLYRSLDPEESGTLVGVALDGYAPDKIGITEDILLALACLRPGSLDGHHGDLFDRGIVYPPVIYHGASSGVASRIVASMPGESANHRLLTLAWIGDQAVIDAFGSWRSDPPAWTASLYVPPHAYAFEAGWELTAEGTRRDLFDRHCHPLVGPHETEAIPDVVEAAKDHEEDCRWCGRRMTTMLDLDLASPELSFLGLEGARLRVAACDVCACFGTLLTRIDREGGSTWHGANRRPEYLPPDSSDWDRMPRGGLSFGSTPRPWIEAANWLVPGVRFSQVGGHPTWIEDAQYPRCPGCDRSMPFLAQISNEDFREHSEGIYYLFLCSGCDVTATEYQQS